MRVGIIIKIFIQVSMGIQVKYIEIFKLFTKGINYRVANGVVAAIAKNFYRLQQLHSDGFLYQGKGIRRTGAFKINIAQPFVIFALYNFLSAFRVCIRRAFIFHQANPRWRMRRAL